jgi:hypothetical protein
MLMKNFKTELRLVELAKLPRTHTFKYQLSIILGIHL